MQFAGDEYVWRDLPAYSGDTDAGSVGTDWTGLIEKGLETWGTVEQARQRADVAKTQAQYSYRYPTLPTATAQLPGGTLTYPGFGLPQTYGAQPQNDMWMLLAAAGIVGAAYLFTRK